MARKKHNVKPGHGKLLDAWVAPDDAGDPVGCVATSFTFSPVFFEEECLARFLHLESDPTEDGPLYLVEREEKLAQVACASALVDQHHCKGGRSLRWDMLAARMQGLLHAKVSLLYWSKLLRIIIGSANLTDDGYRRNQEIFGVVDYRVEGESPLSVLADTVTFLRRAAAYSSTVTDRPVPALSRWNGLLDRVATETATWGLTDDQLRRFGLRVGVVFSGPAYPNVFESLRTVWPGGSPPTQAYVVSPFFDRPEAKNAPAHELWNVVRRRGKAAINYHVTAEEIPDEESLFLHAPESLLHATPSGRSDVKTDFYRVILDAGRSLHAKGIWLEDPRWSLYQIGSSNFTSAGTGLSKESNLEANLVYIVDETRDRSARKALSKTFPDSAFIKLDLGVKWKPLSGEEDTTGEELTLPKAFGDGIYHCDENQRATVTLSFCDSPPNGWEVITDGDDELILNEQQWIERGSPEIVEVSWAKERPPSGFWVRWKESGGCAWWPVNVTAGSVLPPPEELKNLPLEVLINILSSARPLHRVLREYLRRREREKAKTNGDPIIDPHKRVDTSQFLLQRTRRISWALNALRERLERPVATLEFLQWRLRGPVGVTALARALVREAKSDEERSFLLSELALELSRAKPEAVSGCLPPKQHVAEIRGVIGELRTLLPDDLSKAPGNLRRYVKSVFDAVPA